MAILLCSRRRRHVGLRVPLVSGDLSESLFSRHSARDLGGKLDRLLHHRRGGGYFYPLAGYRARMALVHRHRILRRSHHFLDLLCGDSGPIAIGADGVRLRRGGAAFIRFSCDDLCRNRNGGLAQSLINPCGAVPAAAGTSAPGIPAPAQSAPDLFSTPPPAGA